MFSLSHVLNVATVTLALGINPKEQHKFYSEVDKLFVTNARHQYGDEKAFYAASEGHHDKVMRRLLNEEHSKTHPFIIKVAEHCDHLCHSSIRAHFHSDHYSIINTEYGLLTAAPLSVEQFTSRNPSMISHFTPMLPAMKIKSEIDGICRTYRTPIPFSSTPSSVDRVNTHNKKSTTQKASQTQKQRESISIAGNVNTNAYTNANIDANADGSSSDEGLTTRRESLPTHTKTKQQEQTEQAKVIKLRFTISPQTAEELQDFIAFATQALLQSPYGQQALMEYDYTQPYTKAQTYAIVALTDCCPRKKKDATTSKINSDGNSSSSRDDSSSDGLKPTSSVSSSSGDTPYLVASLLSTRREVVAVEVAHQVKLDNYWGNALTDTAVLQQRPLDHFNISGVGEIIGVTDTGIDMNSCYFYDPDCSTPFSIDGSVVNYKCRKVVQYVNRTDSFDDESGHGTHVAGTVAGVSFLNYGDFARFNGNAPGAKIAFFDIGRANQPLTLPGNYNTEMFLVLYNGGARVITNSWGTDGPQYDTGAENADAFMWENPDALLVFSAGNTGCLTDCFETVGSPASGKNVLTVGSNLNDHQSWQAYSEPDVSNLYGAQSVAGYSSRGPTADGRLKPDVLAPGWWVTSARSSPSDPNYHCRTTGLRGTSMSAPLTAAFAAKVRLYFTQGYYPSGQRTAVDGFTPSGSLLKAIMVHSSQKMLYVMNDTADGFGNTVYRNVEDANHGYPSVIQGYGRVQMNKVLNFALSSSNPLNLWVVGSSNTSMPHYAALLNETDVGTHTVQPSNAGAVRLTFSYTDSPGVAGATDVRTNLLEVEVLNTRSSQRFTPYALNGIVTSNLQVVDIPATEMAAGDPLTITVKASSMSVSPQPYSLVVTSDGQLNYLPEYVVPVYKPPTKAYISFTAGVTIACLGFVCLIILIVVFYFRRLTALQERNRKAIRSMNTQSADEYPMDNGFHSNQLQEMYQDSYDFSEQDNLPMTLRSGQQPAQAPKNQKGKRGSPRGSPRGQ